MRYHFCGGFSGQPKFCSSPAWRLLGITDVAKVITNASRYRYTRNPGRRGPAIISHAITTVTGVFVVMPLAFAGHAKLTAALERVAMPYGLKLALCSVAFVGCVLGLSLANFECGRALCRATVGYGCLRG